MSLARLLTLPLEIRELVWEHVLTEADQTLVTFRLDAFQREYYSYSTQPALARVSRQIRSESLPVRCPTTDADALDGCISDDLALCEEERARKR